MFLQKKLEFEKLLKFLTVLLKFKINIKRRMLQLKTQNLSVKLQYY
jgi:hypothetical protein